MLGTVICNATQADVRLAFLPSTSRNYTYVTTITSEQFHLSRAELNPSDKPLLRQRDDDEITSVHRWSRKGKNYILNCHFSGKSGTSDSEVTETRIEPIKKQSFAAKFSPTGSLMERIFVPLGKNHSTSLNVNYSPTFGRSQFLQLFYPKQKIHQNSSWVRKVDVRDYAPNSEFTSTQKGPPVEFRYRVLDVRKHEVDVELKLDARVNAYTWPVDRHFVEESHEEALFTLDIRDGMLIRGDYRTSGNNGLRGWRSLIKLRRI